MRGVKGRSRRKGWSHAYGSAAAAATCSRRCRLALHSRGARLHSRRRPHWRGGAFKGGPAWHGGFLRSRWSCCACDSKVNPQCVAPHNPPTQSPAFISSKESPSLPYSNPLLSSLPANPTTHQTLPNHSDGRSNLISVKFAADVLYCAPPAKSCLIYHITVEPRAGRWGDMIGHFLKPERYGGSWKSDWKVDEDFYMWKIGLLLSFFFDSLPHYCCCFKDFELMQPAKVQSFHYEAQRHCFYGWTYFAPYSVKKHKQVHNEGNSGKSEAIKSRHKRGNTTPTYFQLPLLSEIWSSTWVLGLLCCTRWKKKREEVAPLYHQKLELNLVGTFFLKRFWAFSETSFFLLLLLALLLPNIAQRQMFYRSTGYSHGGGAVEGNR